MFLVARLFFIVHHQFSQQPSLFGFFLTKYRGVNKGLYVLLSSTQAGPGRTVKQEQEEISRNRIQTFIYLSVLSGLPLPALVTYWRRRRRNLSRGR